MCGFTRRQSGQDLGTDSSNVWLRPLLMHYCGAPWFCHDGKLNTQTMDNATLPSSWSVLISTTQKKESHLPPVQHTTTPPFHCASPSRTRHESTQELSQQIASTRMTVNTPTAQTSFRNRTKPFLQIECTPNPICRPKKTNQAKTENINVVARRLNVL
ncbi:hypothetical protein VTJ04DRAFT_6734 [Mycothermus thermophilus]|uniref:uncharacterized protein n=1 Tax=Humicola insolens TaxID=85995 RepID=UPI0037435273